MSTTRLARRKSFQCRHLYQVGHWTEQMNQTTFGACFTPNGHGHNYCLEAHFEGPIDPITGMIVNLSEVDLWLTKTVEIFAGKHLNHDLPEFKETVPTTEKMISMLWQKLDDQLSSVRSASSVRAVKLRLYESDDLWVDLWP